MCTLQQWDTAWLLRSQCRAVSAQHASSIFLHFNACVSISIVMCAYQVVSVYVLIDESMLEVHVCIGFDPQH